MLNILINQRFYDMQNQIKNQNEQIHKYLIFKTLMKNKKLLLTKLMNEFEKLKKNIKKKKLNNARRHELKSKDQ